jgi:hypothetical protein
MNTLAQHLGWTTRRVAAAGTAAILLLALVLTIGVGTSDRADSATHAAAGAGETIIQGGTGGDTPLPVTTVVAFHARPGGGHFECLALAPPRATGPGSGEFTVNVMYVTGEVRSLTVNGDTAVLRGVATVTGIGAGQRQPFTVRLTEGGPGATLVLTISGLTFREILVDGRFTVK